MIRAATVRKLELPPPAPGVHRVIIRDWLPCSLNALFAVHWATRNRLKRDDATIVAASCNYQSIPHAKTKRRVTIRYWQPRGPLSDPDNRLKSLLDALVVCGRLVDDSPKWCELGSVSIERGPRMTVVDFEDVDG